MAPTEADCIKWVTGLNLLCNEGDTESDKDPLQTKHSNTSCWLRKFWNASADTIKDNNMLDLDSVTEIFKKINIRLSKSELKSMFKVI